MAYAKSILVTVLFQAVMPRVKVYFINVKSTPFFRSYIFETWNNKRRFSFFRSYISRL